MYRARGRWPPHRLQTSIALPMAFSFDLKSPGPQRWFYSALPFPSRDEETGLRRLSPPLSNASSETGHPSHSYCQSPDHQLACFSRPPMPCHQDQGGHHPQPLHDIASLPRSVEPLSRYTNRPADTRRPATAEEGGRTDGRTRGALAKPEDTRHWTLRTQAS